MRVFRERGRPRGVLFLRARSPRSPRARRRRPGTRPNCSRPRVLPGPCERAPGVEPDREGFRGRASRRAGRARRRAQCDRSAREPRHRRPSRGRRLVRPRVHGCDLDVEARALAPAPGRRVHALRDRGAPPGRGRRGARGRAPLSDPRAHGHRAHLLPARPPGGGRPRAAADARGARGDRPEPPDLLRGSGATSGPAASTRAWSARTSRCCAPAAECGWIPRRSRWASTARRPSGRWTSCGAAARRAVSARPASPPTRRKRAAASFRTVAPCSSATGRTSGGSPQAPDSPVAGKVGALPMLPESPGGAAGGTLGGWGFGISRRSRNPRLAAEFIRYAISARRDSARSARRRATLPARAAAYRDPALLAVEPFPPGARGFHAERRRPRPTIPRYAVVSDILQRHLSAALAGRADARRARVGRAGDAPRPRERGRRRLAASKTRGRDGRFRARSARRPSSRRPRSLLEMLLGIGPRAPSRTARSADAASCAPSCFCPGRSPRPSWRSPGPGSSTTPSASRTTSSRAPGSPRGPSRGSASRPARWRRSSSPTSGRRRPSSRSSSSRASRESRPSSSRPRGRRPLGAGSGSAASSCRSSCRPSSSPSLFRAVQAFGAFDLVYVMTGGGPGGSTETVSSTRSRATSATSTSATARRSRRRLPLALALAGVARGSPAALEEPVTRERLGLAAALALVARVEPRARASGSSLPR